MVIAKYMLKGVKDPIRFYPDITSLIIYDNRNKFIIYPTFGYSSAYICCTDNLIKLHLLGLAATFGMRSIQLLEIFSICS